MFILKKKFRAKMMNLTLEEIFKIFLMYSPAHFAQKSQTWSICFPI